MRFDCEGQSGRINDTGPRAIIVSIIGPNRGECSVNSLAAESRSGWRKMLPHQEQSQPYHERTDWLGRAQPYPLQQGGSEL